MINTARYTHTSALCALCALCIAVFLGLGTLAHAQNKPAQDEQAAVTLLLKAYDRFPTVAQFNNAAKDPRAQLLRIWNDSKQPEILRLQALDGLSLFPNAEVRQVFLHVVQRSAQQNPAPREIHRAITGFAHGFGPGALREILPELLQHDDPQVRLTAAHVVATSKDEKSRRIVLQHLSKEPDVVVRGEIKRLLARVQ